MQQLSSDLQRPIRLAMMIDDEPIDQMTFRRAVKRSGLVDEIIGCASAQEALDYLGDPANPRVDVVFLDINMPRMNGLEFLEAATLQIGPEFARSCVVMLSASLTIRDRAFAEKFDVVRDFVNKPLRSGDLSDVASMLAGPMHGTMPH